MSLSDSQLKAVCRLLDDDSPGMAAVLDRQVAGFSAGERERLFAMLKGRGTKAGTDLPPSLMGLHHGQIERGFSEWSRAGGDEPSLEEACFLLTAFGYPAEDMEAKKDELEAMENDLRRRLEGIGEAEAVIGEVREYLHGELRFAGDKENYYDARNSFINCVLDRRRGLPISLSALYLILAARLALPYQGVGMPGHFIVKYQPPEAEPIFLDPFDGGKRLSVEDCAEIVRGFGYRFDMTALKETPPRRIVERMLGNLIGVYRHEGAAEEEACLRRCRKLVRGG